MSLACPVCGGAIDAVPGEVFAVCRYCRSSVFVAGSSILGRYVVQQTLSARSAERALRRWMAGNQTIKGLEDDAKIEPSSLEWLPVWFARTRDAGSVRTVEARADDRIVPEAKDQLIPAASMKRVDDSMALAERLPAPTVSLEDFERVSVQGSEAIELALVHVPFHAFAYTYGGQRFTVAVDAATGKVRPAEFPKKREAPFVLLTLATLTAYMIAACWIAGAIAWDWELPPMIKLAPPATFGGSALLAFVVARLF